MQGDNCNVWKENNSNVLGNQNLERSDTKKWLNEVMDVLFLDTKGDEKKTEHKRLEEVITRHMALLPKVKDTQVKSEVGLGWKYYKYSRSISTILCHI